MPVQCNARLRGTVLINNTCSIRHPPHGAGPTTSVPNGFGTPPKWPEQRTMHSNHTVIPRDRLRDIDHVQEGAQQMLRMEQKREAPRAFR